MIAFDYGYPYEIDLVNSEITQQDYKHSARGFNIDEDTKIFTAKGDKYSYILTDNEK